MKKKSDIVPLSGDAGKTSLYSGEELSKSSLRIDALGDIDELNSLLGVCRSSIKEEVIKQRLLEIQQALYHLGSELATTDDSLHKLNQRIDEDFVARWAKTIDDLKRSLTLSTHFVIPGKTLSGSYIDLARTVSRRMERSIVRLFEKGEIKNGLLLTWCNRLSYYLFLLARREDTNISSPKE